MLFLEFSVFCSMFLLSSPFVVLCRGVASSNYCSRTTPLLRTEQQKRRKRRKSRAAYKNKTSWIAGQFPNVTRLCGFPPFWANFSRNGLVLAFLWLLIKKGADYSIKTSGYLCLFKCYIPVPARKYNVKRTDMFWHYPEFDKNTWVLGINWGSWGLTAYIFGFHR